MIDQLHVGGGTRGPPRPTTHGKKTSNCPLLPPPPPLPGLSRTASPTLRRRRARRRRPAATMRPPASLRSTACSWPTCNTRWGRTSGLTYRGCDTAACFLWDFVCIVMSCTGCCTELHFNVCAPALPTPARRSPAPPPPPLPPPSAGSPLPVQRAAGVRGRLCGGRRPAVWRPPKANHLQPHAVHALARWVRQAGRGRAERGAVRLRLASIDKTERTLSTAQLHVCKRALGGAARWGRCLLPALPCTDPPAGQLLLLQWTWTGPLATAAPATTLTWPRGAAVVAAAAVAGPTAFRCHSSFFSAAACPRAPPKACCWGSGTRSCWARCTPPACNGAGGGPWRR